MKHLVTGLCKWYLEQGVADQPPSHPTLVNPTDRWCARYVSEYRAMPAAGIFPSLQTETKRLAGEAWLLNWAGVRQKIWAVRVLVLPAGPRRHGRPQHADGGVPGGRRGELLRPRQSTPTVRERHCRARCPGKTFEPRAHDARERSSWWANRCLMRNGPGMCRSTNRTSRVLSAGCQRNAGDDRAEVVPCC